MKSKPINMCLTCGKSSNAGNVCAYEEKETMAYCFSAIKMKKKKISKK